MVEQERGRGKDYDGVSLYLCVIRGISIRLNGGYSTENAENFKANMHVKICSSICNHKSTPTAARVGCRLWYAMVCPGGNCAVDKWHRKIVEEARVKDRCWS